MNSKEQEIEKRSILDPLIDKVFGSSRSSRNKNKSVSKRTEALAGRISSDLTAMVKMTSKIQTAIQKNQDSILTRPEIVADPGKASKILDNMLSFMQKSREQDTQEFDTQSSFNEMNAYTEADRHKEVMNVFIQATKQKRAAEKNMSKESKKRKVDVKKEEKKPEPAKKGEPPAKTETKPAETSKQKETPKEDPNKGAADKARSDKAAKDAADKARSDKAAKDAADKARSDKAAKDAADKARTDKKRTAEPVKEAKPSALKEKVKEGVKTAARAGAIVAVATASGVGAFAKQMFPYAKMASEKLGGKIPPEAILAQWANETGNGKHVSAPFNFAGIKAGRNDKKGPYTLTEEFYTDAQLEKAKSSGESFERVVEFGDKIKKGGKDVDAWQFHGGAGKKGEAYYNLKKSEGKKMVQVRSYFAQYDSIEEFTNAYVKFLSSDRYKKARESTTSSSFGFEVAQAGYATQGAKNYSEQIGNYVGQNAELLGSLSTQNADMTKDLSQQSSGPTVLINQNNTNNQQKTVVTNPQRTEELNPTMRR